LLLLQTFDKGARLVCLTVYAQIEACLWSGISDRSCVLTAVAPPGEELANLDCVPRHRAELVCY